jgi:hypothetical protein
LPGYVGDNPVLSEDPFNAHQYNGQAVRLIAVGLEDYFSKVEFHLSAISVNEGYAENMGIGTDPDVSFEQLLDDDDFTDLSIDDGEASAIVWVKDYGASADVEVKFFQLIGEQHVEVFGLEFALPPDHDNDHIADVWERAMIDEWNEQYHASEMDYEDPADLAFFGPNDDFEALDPDGTTDALGFVEPTPAQIMAGHPPDSHEHDAIGDGRTILEEYRGFILDGGGFDWTGVTNHQGGHARLIPAIKELLVEVDVMENPGGGSNLPNLATTTAWMNEVSAGVSQAADGAGYYLYFVLSDMATPHVGAAGLMSEADIIDYITTGDVGGTSFIDLPEPEFTHLHLFGEFDAGLGTGGESWVGTGAAIAVDTVNGYAWGALGTVLPSYISHELHHMTIPAAVGGDDMNGHFDDTNGNGVDLEAADFDRILFNYNNPAAGAAGYVGQDYLQITYGRGTTRFVIIT